MHMWFLAGASALSLAAASASAQDIGGNYAVAGTNFDGSPYKGTVVVTPTGDTTCRIAWDIGGAQSAGICMRTGATFTAAYQLGEAIGLAVYTIQGDGTLDGVWTIADQSGQGTERLVPQR